MKSQSSPLANDPLLTRLRDAVGSFKVDKANRYVRVILDLDLSGAENPPAIEAALGFIQNWATPDGNIPQVGLALRELSPGDKTVGYDPAIVYLFGLGANSLAPPKQGEVSEPCVVKMPSVRRKGGAA